ncbi:hypothetical protein N657DRAFT_305331 [Parathielavia appendiculata]|uniref:Uncharacterized protein n=1 Tax=Parathielavia appendiculata TaxID=2587402 RepID=A0AAN6U4R3_9PEZI|nr:hypothetical protein N657DRAFT_305331 [Parathielavia appendiculata]
MATIQCKRKRAPSDAVINPLSHTPDTLKQFAVAGYPAEQPLPSKAFYPGFPHRPPRPKTKGPKKLGCSGPADADANADYPGSSSSARALQGTPRGGSQSGAASDADVETNGEDGEEDTETGWWTTDFDDTEDDNSSRLTVSGERKRSKSSRKEGSKGKGKNAAGFDRRAHAYRARVGCLAAVVRRCLAEGDIGTAKRAFGLLARAKVYGRNVDLRWERYWEMGAEVLMREGEAPSDRVDQEGVDEEGDGAEDGGVEWHGEREVQEGEERLARLKAYYGYLIQQYPYSKQQPASANSVLDFQVAMFSAEMEAAYAAHKRGLESLQRDGGWEDDMDVEEPMDYDLDDGQEGAGDGKTRDDLRGLSRRELRLRGKEDDLRLAALRRMVDVAQRMDTVMEMVPFSRDHELLRLRAMVALYMGDLYVPPAPRPASEDRDSRRARAGQRAKAKGLLRRIKEGGRELKDHDEALLESLASDDDRDEEDEDTSVLPMFSSLEF